MFDALWQIFDTRDFPARWHCGQWTSLHGWTHIGADLLIWGAYVTIPLLLAYFVIRRRDIPFQPIFWCFFLFIISCGTTHLMEATIFWWPAYRLAAMIKIVTALASWGTVAALCWVVPHALTLRSPRELEIEISQRRQAEDALRRSEERFRNTFEYAAVGMAVMTPTGRFLDVNPAFCALTGYTSGELHGRELRELIELDDYLIFNEDFTKLLAGETPFIHTEVRGVNSVGKIFWAHFAVSMAPGEPGQSAICLLQVQDITKRRNAQRALESSEERLRHLFTHNPIAVYEIDLEPLANWVKRGLNAGETSLDRYRKEHAAELSEVASRVRVRDTNPAAVELFEADDKEHFTESFSAVFDGRAPEDAFEAELDAFWNARPRVALERVGKTLRGRHIDCLLHWVPAKDAGDVSSTIVAVTDITERKRLEEKMRQTQKLESLGVLAGGIAHDFNNLMMGVLGNADLAVLDLAPESPGREPIVNIRKSALCAADLCKQMLAYSGRGRFEIQTIHLASLVSEMGHLLSASITKSATLRYKFSPETLPVEGDAAQLRQVVLNLVTNASDALGDKGGSITVVVGTIDVDEAFLASTYFDDKLPSGSYSYLEVSDTGVGLGAEEQRRIFEPFYTTKFTGRGLGLAAVTGIVRGLRGAIHLESHVEQGTTIRVLLPSSKKSTCMPSSSEGGVPIAWHGSGTLLLVDDDDAARSHADSILCQHGFKVVSTCNGVQAVTTFARLAHEICLVVLDTTMPRREGDNTLRELRRIRPEIPVLLTSGYNEPNATSNFTPKMPAGFIQKPYRCEQLLERVRQVLGDV